MKHILYDIESYDIITIQDSPHVGGSLADKSKYAWISCPDNINPKDAKITKYRGQMNVREDAAKKTARQQEARELKLNELRMKRDEKLKEVDRMINELVLQIRTNEEEVKEYRSALLSITDEYKDEDGHATSSIDNLDLDDSAIWPARP